MYRNARNGYGAIAILLHWTAALLIFGQFALGLTMVRLSDQRLAFDLIQLHKSVGFLILGLMALRLAWRIANPKPLPVPSLAGWEIAAAAAVHRLLYAMFLTLPLSGWALVSSSVLAVPTLAFGVFLIPHLPLPVSEAAETFWRQSHHLLALVAFALVAGHAAAALRHHFVLRDGVMRRMLTPAQGGRLGQTDLGPGGGGVV